MWTCPARYSARLSCELGPSRVLWTWIAVCAADPIGGSVAQEFNLTLGRFSPSTTGRQTPGTSCCHIGRPTLLLGLGRNFHSDRYPVDLPARHISANLSRIKELIILFFYLRSAEDITVPVKLYWRIKTKFDFSKIPDIPSVDS